MKMKETITIISIKDMEEEVPPQTLNSTQEYLASLLREAESVARQIELVNTERVTHSRCQQKERNPMSGEGGRMLVTSQLPNLQWLIKKMIWMKATKVQGEAVQMLNWLFKTCKKLDKL